MRCLPFYFILEVKAYRQSGEYYFVHYSGNKMLFIEGERIIQFVILGLF